MLTISRPISRDCMHILRTARQFLGNHKNNEFMGKFMEISGREETASFSRKSFSFRNDRLCICTVFSSPSSAKFTEETHSTGQSTDHHATNK